jgi:pseudouridine-5'-phosphate glycosidase
MKLSRADLPFAVATGRHGATTVAATMICAHLAGVPVFATGGIGGVHRGVEATMDISADLDELARTPVTVVCAGAKAILDLPRTLEYLETRGVPVVGYQTDRFPAFWSRTSELPAPLRIDTPEEIAGPRAHQGGARPWRRRAGRESRAARARDPGGRDRGLHRTALAEASKRGIAGKAVTPFLLSHMFEITGGRSLATNIALVRNNAALAARIAVALSARRVELVERGRARHQLGLAQRIQGLVHGGQPLVQVLAVGWR